MTHGSGQQSLTARMMGKMRSGVGRAIPERWRQRLSMLRGLLVGDGSAQLSRVMAVIRHFGEYRRVERMLADHRAASMLLVAHRLGLFEEISHGASTIDDVAERCGVRREAMRNLLVMLRNQGWVTQRGNLWRTTEAARQLFTRRAPGSMVPMFEVAEAYAAAFPRLVDAAESGTPPPLLDVFDDRGRIDALLDGVNFYIDQAGRELFGRVDFPDVRHFIVGSMGVSFSALMLDQFRGSRVTYGCLPHLVERIPRLRKEYGVEPDRVVETHAHGGEPSEDEWGREAFDVVFLTKKMILDPENRLGEKFATRAFRVLNPGGATVFWETIYEDDGSSPIERGLEGFLDFGVSPTGPTLTRRKFRDKLRAIGYRDIEVISCLEGATTFVIARRRS